MWTRLGLPRYPLLSTLANTHLLFTNIQAQGTPAALLSVHSSKQATIFTPGPLHLLLFFELVESPSRF